MSQSFELRNELERQLLAVQQGEITGDVFMNELIHSQVFMPVQDDATNISNFQRSDKAVPLTLEAEDGLQVMILFTSPERAKLFLQDFPDFDGGLLAEFTWVLERIRDGMGISLNPGWDTGIDMDPDTVRNLAGHIPAN